MKDIFFWYLIVLWEFTLKLHLQDLDLCVFICLKGSTVSAPKLPFLLYLFSPRCFFYIPISFTLQKHQKTDAQMRFCHKRPFYQISLSIFCANRKFYRQERKILLFLFQNDYSKVSNKRTAYNNRTGGDIILQKV